jgi:rhamnose utilization protein RhaD (predicted bifunctional aldolase and dehydrogenase)
MDQRIKDLIEISRYYGAKKEYVLAGGGNTSYKNSTQLFIKASGISLATIDEDGFVCLSRGGLKKIAVSAYSSNAQQREEEVKHDLNACVLSKNGKRPSVETSLHEIIDYPFVVHTHPTLVNAVLCSKQGKVKISNWFQNKAIFVEYTDPGYVLFKKVMEMIGQYQATFHSTPQLIFLENHGVFVAANTIAEIMSLYIMMMQKINNELGVRLPDSTFTIDKENAFGFVESATGKKSLFASSPLIHHFASDRDAFENIAYPFTPDNIVYCKSKYLFVENNHEILSEIQGFEKKNGYLPKVVVVKGKGLLMLEDTEKTAQTVLEVFEDMMKISYLSGNFGGPQFMTPAQIAFIDNWEVENYRRKIAKE